VLLIPIEIGGDAVELRLELSFIDGEEMKEFIIDFKI
jgi:hypothetical protein